MRTVYIDGYYFDYEALGGISRMWVELIKYVISSSDDIRFIINVGKKTNNVFLGELEKSVSNADGRLIVAGKEEPFYLRPRLLNSFGLFRAIHNRKILSDFKYDIRIFHSSYMSTVSPKIKGIPVVVTVHDMILQKFKRLFVSTIKSHVNYYRRLITENYAIKSADYLIAVSETSKKDLIDYFGFENDRINVIYHGIRDFWFSKTETTQEHSDPYFLFVGGRNPYKNYDTLLNAFALIDGKHKDLRLITVGENSRTKDQEKLMYRKLGITDRVIDLGIVTDEELRALYSHAIAFVFPSVYEGFGFPLLESFACGCPVIASDISTNKEMGSPFVKLFSTIDEQDLAEKMIGLYERPPSKAERDMFVNHARKFTWGAAARKLVQLYKSI